MHLDVLQDCKIVSTNELEKMFQPLGSIAGSIYRVSCTKSIYVHLQPFQQTLSCCVFCFVFLVGGCSVAIGLLAPTPNGWPTVLGTCGIGNFNKVAQDTWCSCNNAWKCT
jgi:hypothetical protein